MTKNRRRRERKAALQAERAWAAIRNQPQALFEQVDEWVARDWKRNGRFRVMGRHAGTVNGN